LSIIGVKAIIANALIAILMFMCVLDLCPFPVLRTDGILKNALPLYRLRHLLVLTTCGIIYLHGYAVLLVVADRQASCRTDGILKNALHLCRLRHLPSTRLRRAFTCWAEKYFWGSPPEET
jgi:hypothetical protein